MYKSLLHLSFLVMGTLGFEGTAFAQSCDQLKAMLNQSQFYSAPASSIARYNKAIKKQRKFLVQVNSDLRRHHCNGLTHAKACAQLQHSRQQMEANLAHLKQELAQIKARPTAISKQQIRSKMADKHCLSASFVSLKRAQNNDEFSHQTTLDIDPNSRSNALTAVPRNSAIDRANGQNWTTIARQTDHEPQEALANRSDGLPNDTLEELRISPTQTTPSVTNIAVNPNTMIENDDDHSNLTKAEERQVRKIGPTFLPEREIYFEK